MLVLFATDDLGSGLLFYGIFLGMLYVATARIAFVAAGLGLFLVGSVAVYQGTPHVRERVLNWIQPWTTHKIFCPLSGAPAFRQDCQSYQEVQSLYSIAHGGMGGTGLGSGTFANASGGQIIPDLNTDFIYSALAQELGLIGAAGLLLVYMVFTLRGFRVAIFAGDGFSKLLAAGLTFGFAFQTFIIVGGILRVIPLTGITLPLVSYGGSSILANFLVLAGLMLVSNRANAELGGAMNRQLNRLAVVVDRAARRARRRDDVLADVGRRRACRTGRTTRSSASCSSTIARGLIQGAGGKTTFATNKKVKHERPDALLPPLPAARPRGADGRLLDRRRARRPGSSAR